MGNILLYHIYLSLFYSILVATTQLIHLIMVECYQHQTHPVQMFKTN